MDILDIFYIFKIFEIFIILVIFSHFCDFLSFYYFSQVFTFFPIFSNESTRLMAMALFLDASTHLYKRVCLSVHPWVSHFFQIVEINKFDKSDKPNTCKSDKSDRITNLANLSLQFYLSPQLQTHLCSNLFSNRGLTNELTIMGAQRNFFFH